MAKEPVGVAVFLFDVTGIAAAPWLKAGYECWLFDGQHEEGVHREGNLVRVGMWFDPKDTATDVAEIVHIIGKPVDIVIGFPECTDLTVAGAKHWGAKRLKNAKFQEDALALFRLPERLGNAYNCPWMAENPVGAVSTLWRKPDFTFHPADYGGYLPKRDFHPMYPDIYPPRDAYPKKTCIWCGNGFVRPEPDPVPSCKDNPGWAKTGGKSQRTKNIRSATPRGFARAVYVANRLT